MVSATRLVSGCCLPPNPRQVWGARVMKASAAKESNSFPFRSARSRAWRGFESHRSNALTRTFASKTQRNYAPLSRESNISGGSPRAFAFRPTSSSTCCREGYSPAASSRSQRLNRAWILRFSSGAAELYAWAICGSRGIAMVGFAVRKRFVRERNRLTGVHHGYTAETKCCDPIEA